MTPVHLKALLACRERLGITEVIEPHGTTAYAEGVLTYPRRDGGMPTPSPRAIMILPPDIPVGCAFQGPGDVSPLQLSYPIISCTALAEAPRLGEPIRRYSERTRTPVFASRYDAALLQSRLLALLGELGERRVVVHGVLVEVGGVGVLITGESGVGKTACGISLVDGGALWVADDVVILSGKGDSLYGNGHPRIRRWLALRGRGLIRTETLLGKEAMVDRTRVNCVVRLDDSGGEWALRGVQRMSNCTIAGVSLPRWRVAAGDSNRAAGLVMRIVAGLKDPSDEDEFQMRRGRR